MYLGFAAGWIGLWVIFGHPDPRLIAAVAAVALAVRLFVLFYEEAIRRADVAREIQSPVRRVSPQCSPLVAAVARQRTAAMSASGGLKPMLIRGAGLAARPEAAPSQIGSTRDDRGGASRQPALSEVEGSAVPTFTYSYQTWQAFSATMGWPALHPQAFWNSGMFCTTPSTRYLPGE